MLPGKAENNHVLNNCLQELLNCTLHQDITALLYKGFAITVASFSAETILRGRNMENNLP